MVSAHISAESAADPDDEAGDDADPATEILYDHRLEELQLRRRNRRQDADDRRGLQDSLDESITLLRMAVAERGAPDDYDALVARLLEQATPLLASRNRAAAHAAHAERIAIRRTQATGGDARARQALGVALAEAARHQQRWGSAADVPALLTESLATLRLLARERGTPGDHYALGIALAHARSIARECGDHAQARQHDGERLAALCQVVRLRGRAIDRRALLDAVAAALTAAQDDHARIVAVLDAALAALRQCADDDAAIDVLNLLRMTVQALQPHDLDRALQAAHQALAWCQQHDLAHHTHGSRYELGRAWFQLADVQRSVRQFGDALHGYRQSIIVWRSLSTGRLLVSFPMIIALALRHCGTCAAAIDDDATALACFGECRQMLESYTDQSLQDVVMLAELWHEVCQFHLTRRQLGPARTAGQASLRLWRSVCAVRQIAADRRALAQVRQALRDIRRLQSEAAGARVCRTRAPACRASDAVLASRDGQPGSLGAPA
jgi:predicted nucleic acid-binding Zn ribbon protein